MKKIVFIFFLSFSTYPFFAQTIGEFFVFLPDQHLILLNSAQRMELINDALNKKDSTVLNSYGGRSKLLIFDADNHHIKVQTSRQGFFEVKKWTLGDSVSLFATNTWVCSPACDGAIQFLKSNYTPLHATGNLLPEITISDFLNKDSIAARDLLEEDVKNKFDLFFIYYEFLPAENDILAINDNEKYMNSEDYKKLKPCLAGNALRLTWNGKRFEKGKAYFKEPEFSDIMDEKSIINDSVEEEEE